MSDGDDRLERGRELARRHLGDGTVERWRAISPDLEELTSAFGFGDLWSRPGLGRRDRSIVALAVTATLRAGPQLGWHVRGALGAGVTPAEVREVLIAVSGLAGFPAAWSALEVAEPILAEHEGRAAGEAGGDPA
jgi:alkylhydroperoxidase/carboxymuconolactone decarboxylase family protein YurZ